MFNCFCAYAKKKKQKNLNDNLPLRRLIFKKIFDRITLFFPVILTSKTFSILIYNRITTVKNYKIIGFFFSNFKPLQIDRFLISIN